MMLIVRIKSIFAQPQLLALLDQAVVSGGNFLTLLLIGRQLAAEDFGPFSLAMMGVLFLSNLHRATLTQPLNILGAAEQPGWLAGRLAALLRAHWLAIPLATAILALLSARFFPGTALLLGCAGYAGAFFLQDMLRRYWYTAKRTDLALLNDLISYGAQVLLLLLAGPVWPVDGPGAFVIMAATSLIAFMLGLRDVVLPRAGVAPPIGTVLRQHWHLSRWLIPTVLAVWGASQIYPFLIAGLGPVAVAFYAASRNLLSATGLIIQSIGNYVPIHAAAVLRQQGASAFRMHLLQTLGRTALAGLLFVMAMLLLAGWLMHLLYGGTYDAGVPLLRILALGTFFSLMGAVLGAYSLAMEDSRSSFLANLGASAFTFTIGLWLIRSHGITGAAIAATLSTVTSMTLQGAFVFTRLNRLPAKVRPKHDLASGRTAECSAASHAADGEMR